MIAAMKGNTNTVKMLLQAGANANNSDLVSCQKCLWGNNSLTNYITYDNNTAEWQNRISSYQK